MLEERDSVRRTLFRVNRWRSRSISIEVRSKAIDFKTISHVLTSTTWKVSVSCLSAF